MKSFFNAFMSFCETVGTARAASALARAGKSKEAIALYNK